MKRNFNIQVKDFDGTLHVRPKYKYDEKGLPLLDDKKANVFSHFEPMTLRTYAIDSLGARLKGEESVSNDELYKRMKLCDRLVFAGDAECEISSDEGRTILDCMNKANFSPLIIGRTKDLIDTDPEPKEVAA